MEIQEKLEVVVDKEGKKYYCYGPDIRSLEVGQFSAGTVCWLMTKPISQAKISDVVECVDCIKVWFSDFQIYKHLLKKMYGFEKFNALSKKRWEFLDFNKNRFHLIRTLVGDYGMVEDEFEILCFDTVQQEYILVSLDNSAGSCFEIRKLVSSETDAGKVYDEITKTEVFERNCIEISQGNILYTLENKEYEPLFKFYDFVESFYYFFVIDGGLISHFLPLDPQKYINKIDL